MIALNDIDRLLTTEQAAELLGLAPQTLADKRWRGGGPPFVKIARNVVRYRRKDLLAFADARVATSTLDATRKPPPQT